MVFPMPRQRLFLIDTFGFIFRAFHARGRQAVASMRTSTGTPTEAVYIFNNMLRKRAQFDVRGPACYCAPTSIRTCRNTS
jgi:5'-3' exonuclease